MPVAPAIIAALIGAATTAGETIYQAVSQPGAPKIPTTTTPAAIGPTKQQILTASAPYAANIQALTGGSLSPDYYAQTAPTQAGVAGQTNTQNAMRQLIAQMFGTRLPGAAALPNTGGGNNVPFQPSGTPSNESAAFGASPGVSDFMQKLASELS